MNTDEALRTVDQLYAAALGEAGWEATLASVADAVGASAATLEIQDFAAGNIVHHESARIDGEMREVYLRDFGLVLNPRAQFMRHHRQPVGFDRLFMTEEQMDRDPFYADLLARWGLRYFVAVQTPMLDDRIVGVLTIQHPGLRGSFTRETVDDMNALSAHIGRALKLFWRRRRHIIDPEIFDVLLAREGLTPAERRLAIAIGCGETLHEYSRRVGLSMNTVYTHYRRLKEKLGCASQAELVFRLRLLCRPPEGGPAGA